MCALTKESNHHFVYWIHSLLGSRASVMYCGGEQRPQLVKIVGNCGLRRDIVLKIPIDARLLSRLSFIISIVSWLNDDTALSAGSTGKEWLQVPIILLLCHVYITNRDLWFFGQVLYHGIHFSSFDLIRSLRLVLLAKFNCPIPCIEEHLEGKVHKEFLEHRSENLRCHQSRCVVCNHIFYYAPYYFDWLKFTMIWGRGTITQLIWGNDGTGVSSGSRVNDPDEIRRELWDDILIMLRVR
ncbi:hypothetical protein BCR41DRAFT_198723 [Lobosporangium transversale]|uniref:Uncharacterized protein n=1 Tax=Lobosporangium transversale TaxID=64571 RepID=A0A1Y2G8K4_9FUNG|nr:hypothetical protein BCR41DRAFT_198723 [Lobosporangium transversale]ORZ04294.1 hypothetical protein BCR41DRAFT_198723 [Lobosporangium transversale]|eukprot:XP_021876452.1 hypothetical protein BCR41DRAFT_198723 [Lobosporangium transversale]